MGKVITKEWTKAKRADTGFFFVLPSKIFQALDSKPGSFNHTCISFHFSKMLFAMGDDLSYGLNSIESIPWVRCASGNVYKIITDF